MMEELSKIDEEIKQLVDDGYFGYDELDDICGSVMNLQQQACFTSDYIYKTKEGIKTYCVIGMKSLKIAELKGVHSDRKGAIKQAEFLEKNKDVHCDKKYIVITPAEIENQKIELCQSINQIF